MKILFVDEDQSFAAVYAERLKSSGNFETVVVPDSRTALQALEQRPFDVIVTEVLLPGRNGLKFIGDVRLQEQWLNLPIFILTTLEAADVGLADSLREALGVRAYLVKQQTSPAALAKQLTGVETKD